MSFSRVVSEKQLIERLKALGFSPTGIKTGTGEFWKAKRDGNTHVLVPFSIQGHYPDWMLEDLEKVIGKLNPWTYKPHLH